MITYNYHTVKASLRKGNGQLHIAKLTDGSKAVGFILAKNNFEYIEILSGNPPLTMPKIRSRLKNAAWATRHNIYDIELPFFSLSIKTRKKH